MKNYLHLIISFLSIFAMAVNVTGCVGGKSSQVEQLSNGVAIVLPFSGNMRVTGAGASFPAPLYQNWFVQLNRQVPQLQFNFQSTGSGAGIEQFINGTIDFGASDIAMSDEQIARVKRGVLLLPMSAGSIVLVYNLPGVENLKLTREAYTNIFLGNITNWNDPLIAQANPDIDLPDRPITVVHRSDGSGTTSVFTNHLSQINSEWKKNIGSGTAVEWPASKGTFIAGRGNEGVTALVSQTQGTIGYVEYGFAKKNNLSTVALENQAGNFIVPSDESGTNTLAQVELPENLRAFITDPPGEESYPIVTYTWMLLFEKYDNRDKAIAMEAMIQFGLNEGQKQAAALGYIQLPTNVREKVAAVADEITPDFDIKLSNFDESPDTTAK